MGKYRIVDLKLEVTPLDAKGKVWDKSSVAAEQLPELRVKFKQGPHELGTCSAGDDSLNGQCSPRLLVDFSKGTELSISVRDDDPLASDDDVGVATLEIPTPVPVGTELAMHVSGQLVSAKLVLAEEPSWLVQHKPHLIGLGAGIAIALAAIAVFGEQLFRNARRDPADEPVLQREVES